MQFYIYWVSPLEYCIVKRYKTCVRPTLSRCSKVSQSKHKPIYHAETMGVLLQQKLEENRHISSGLLALAGDAHLQMQACSSHTDDYRDLQDDDLIIANSISLELDKFG